MWPEEFAEIERGPSGLGGMGGPEAIAELAFESAHGVDGDGALESGEEEGIAVAAIDGGAIIVAELVDCEGELLGVTDG